MIATGPSGDTIANALATKQAAGLDSYGVKLMFGDWVYWNDQANGSVRLVSPQGFAADGSLTCHRNNPASINRFYGVIGSQKSGDAWLWPDKRLQQRRTWPASRFRHRRYCQSTTGRTFLGRPPAAITRRRTRLPTVITTRA